MLPHFQLPPRHKAAGTINPNFSPDQVGSWLAKLPHTAADEAAERLARFLNAFSRIDLPAQHRGQLAGLLKVSAWHLAERLSQNLADQPLPLHQAPYRLLSLKQTLLGELANSQKLLVLGSLHQGHDAHATAWLADLLETLGQQILTAFRTHTSPAAGLWHDLHQSYLCAARRGIADTPAAKGQSSIAVNYKSFLLLAMADPYQFTAGEFDWAHALALEVAPLGVITAADTARRALAPFHIHTSQDDSPQPMARHYTKAQNDLLFDTAGIAKHLALLGNAIKNHRSAEGLHLPPEQDWPEYLTLLNKLKLRWGASKHRLVQRRKPQQEFTYEITLGLDSLGLLTGAAPAGGDRVPTVFTCGTLNDSAGGLALQCAGGLPGSIAVGEVIGLRQRHDSHWQVGLVRWFKQQREEELQLGLQLLASQFEPAQARHQGTDKQCTGFLLQGIGSNRPECLLLPKHFGQAGMALTLTLADSDRAIMLKQLAQTGIGLEVFQLAAA
ncbi:MAG: hypothetical protein HXY26_05185 [Hydrogenophilaceae bacterium]|nr:hypothetical protein [Hydrogenophilaceae bacterium]